MKKLAVLMLILCFAIAAIGTPVFAAQKGASDRALERASDESAFNRVTDWFATRGKSSEEKKAILSERKAERMAKRAEKEAKKQAKKAEKASKKASKGLKSKFGKK